MANQVWEYQFSRYSMSNTPDTFDRQSYIKSDAQTIDLLIKNYPEVCQKIRDGRFLNVSDALAVIWQNASTELNYAVKLFALEENNKPTKSLESTKSVESMKSTGNIEARLDKI